MPQIESFAEEALGLLPPLVLDAVRSADLPGLADGPNNGQLAKALADSQGDDWSKIDTSRKSLGMSGLWLLAGDLDRSHVISQNIESPEGSFWHGIMHRREGDFGNSKYWFRRVGAHPVFKQLSELSGGDYVDPFDFVDDCSRALRKGGEDYQRCQRAQWIEWQALMVHCLKP